ncbi:MAG: transporter related protein [Chloroflexi bacterium]|nr:transporter related protein [Chloroflexota bacterium]
MSTQPAVEVSGVSKTFRRGNLPTSALSDVHLVLDHGEFVCLLGPSGCGKSTLLNIVAGFLLPDRGEVRSRGERVRGPGADRCVLFQAPTLFPWWTTRQNVLFGPRAQRRVSPAVHAEADRLIEAMGLTGFSDHYPHQLSGGMRTRVAFARALINRPEVLLLDEPFAALDAITRRSMQEFLLELWQREHTTILFVTHDVEEAALLADRVCVMSARPGEIAYDMPIPLARPRHYDATETAEFIQVRRRLRTVLEGVMNKEAVG